MPILDFHIISEKLTARKEKQLFLVIVTNAK